MATASSTRSRPPRSRTAPKANATPRRPRAPRTLDAVIDAHVAEWVAAGLVERTEWPGRPLLRTPLPPAADVTFDAAAVERPNVDGEVRRRRRKTRRVALAATTALLARVTSAAAAAASE